MTNHRPVLLIGAAVAIVVIGAAALTGMMATLLSLVLGVGVLLLALALIITPLYPDPRDPRDPRDWY